MVVVLVGVPEMSFKKLGTMLLTHSKVAFQDGRLSAK